MALNKIPQRAFDNDDFITDTYTATAGQTAFTMSRAAALNSILVHINDVLQQPTTDYTTSGTTMTLVSGASVGDDVRIRIMSERPLGTAGGGSGVTTLGGLNDVTTTGVSSGQVLKWNGTTWAPAADASGGGGSSLTIQDEGSTLSTAATTLNFVGSGITASGTGATKTITVTGSGGSGIALTDLSVASEGTAAGDGSITYNNTNGQFTYTPPTLNGLTNSGDVDFGSNKILYANVYPTTGDLPSASSYHGMFAHVHGTGKGYYAHAGAWVELANNSQLNLDGLSDVSTSGVSSGQVLKYNGTSWAPAADASGSSGIALSDISVGADATASGDGGLAYNNSTGVFTYTPPVIASEVPLPDDQIFTVTAAGSGAYTFAGGATGNNPTLTLQRGKTYKFSLNASGHPFRIQSTTGTSGTLVTNGVENNTAAVGTIYYTVPDNAPDTLYYQCQIHSAMNGTINIVNNYSAGHILQNVVYKAATETNLAHNSGAFTAWTAALNDFSITPKQADSKIQVTMHLPWVGIANGNTTGQIDFQIWRKIGSGGTWAAIGNSQGGAYIANNTYIQSTIYEEDAPNSTDTIYYRPYFRGRYLSSGEYSVNRGANVSYVYNAMEVAQ